MEEETTLDVQGDEEVGQEAVEPSGPSESNDVGQLSARFRAAGVDLNELDPDSVSRALALHQRVGSAQSVYTEEDVPHLVFAALQRIAAHPQAREYLSQVPGMSALIAKAKEAVEADDDTDPTSKEVRALREQITQQQQLLQSLQGDRNAILAERRAAEVGDQLKQSLLSGIKSVPGAADMDRFIQERFWLHVQSGRIQGQQLTPQGIRQFVASTVKEYGGPKQQTRKPTAGPSSAVQRILAKKQSELTADDVIEGLGAFLPED